MKNCAIKYAEYDSDKTYVKLCNDIQEAIDFAHSLHYPPCDLYASEIVSLAGYTIFDTESLTILLNRIGRINRDARKFEDRIQDNDFAGFSMFNAFMGSDIFSPEDWNDFDDDVKALWREKARALQES